MNTVEKSIDTKVKTLISDSTKNDFSLKNNILNERDWTEKELKKASTYYKILLPSSMMVICTILTVSLLRSSDILDQSNSNDVLISISGILGLLTTLFHYKIKRERLNTALYLLDLKTEIEGLKK